MRCRVACIGRRGRGIVAAAAEHVLADHLDDVDRRRGECDLFAQFQGLQVAAGLQADVTLAEQAVGEDPGRGVDRQVLVTVVDRSEEHTSELQSLMRISYAVFCLKKKKTKTVSHITIKN